MESTCQTCYSTLPPQLLSAAYYTPCCSSPICDRCLARNPRLREYNPCLRCGDVKSASGSNRVRIGEREEEARRQDAADEANQFSIGDDDDEDDQVIDSRPPSYKEGKSEEVGMEGDGSGDKEAEAEMEVVEVTHQVGRGDTLMSISKRYAADPHDLLTLNSLPPTALSSNPRILQTRRSIIISRRLLPKGSSPLPSAMEEQESEEREAERRLKRFQLLTKTTDQGVGKAYLALAGDEERHVLESGSGEVLEGGKKKVKSTGGKEGKEGRALEAYFEDEEWEDEAGRPHRVKEGGRWVVVGRGAGGVKA